MSAQFHVMRKDGSELRSVTSLGRAMDEMQAGFLLYLGTPSDAVRISKALGSVARAATTTPNEGVLLAIGEESGPDRHSIFEGGKL